MDTFGKVTLTLIAALVVGGVALAWQKNKNEWYPLKDQVTATIAPNDVGCTDPEWPLGVSLTNDSGSRLTSMRYEVSVRRSGHSSVLHSETHLTDKILGPSEKIKYCVNRPNENDPTLLMFGNAYKEFPNELEYSVEVVRADGS